MHARVALVLLFACTSCGKPAPPANPASVPIKPAPVEAEPPPDLSPVAAPADLVLVGRLARPRALVETVAGWSGLPVRLLDVLPAEARDLADVVAWDAPIELAAVLDRRSREKVAPPLFVVSVGLTSVNAAVDLAKNRGVNATRVAPGVFRLPVGDELACALAASTGSAPGRLVCGDDWQDIEELLPYATRGLPSADLGKDDLHVELRAAPIRRKYEQELGAIRLFAGLLLRNAQTDSRRLDRALTDAVYGLADELRAVATELETVQITARLDDGRKVLDVGYGVVLQGDQSVTGQVLRDAGKRSATAPDEFWRLPRAAETATYSVGSDEKRWTAVATSLAELADAYLEHEKIAPSLRKRVRALIESYPAALPQTTVSAQAALPADDQDTIVRNFLPASWSVGVTEVRADRVTKIFSELVGLLTDPELPKTLKSKFDFDRKLLPKARRGALQVKGFTARGSSFTFELPAELAKRLSEDLPNLPRPEPEADAPARRPPVAKKPKPVNAVFIVVADGERTFIGYGPDQRTALRELEAFRAGTQPTLASASELEGLKRERAVVGGYATLAGVLASWSSIAKSRGIELSDWVGRMPNRGRSPWVVRARVRESGPRVELSANVEVPQGTFLDIGSVGGDLLRYVMGAVDGGGERSLVKPE